MGKMWTPKPQDLLQSWIDAIVEEASDKLSSWEADFVDSVQSQLLKKGQLSEKQEEILERIYAEKTS